jgi:hypothetical protein
LLVCLGEGRRGFWESFGEDFGSLLWSLAEFCLLETTITLFSFDCAVVFFPGKDLCWVQPVCRPSGFAIWPLICMHSFQTTPFGHGGIDSARLVLDVDGHQAVLCLESSGHPVLHKEQRQISTPEDLSLSHHQRNP